MASTLVAMVMPHRTELPLPHFTASAARQHGPELCRLRRFWISATTDEPSPAAIAADEKGQDGPSDIDDDFEARLAKIQRKVRSGDGKKAEQRKARKSGLETLSSTKGSVLLPPVPLLDPMSDGLPVGLGFNSYAERINGRFAALGLAAILLVELATGGSFFQYHETAIIGVQIYFMLAVSVVFIKYEKEKKSIWPKG